MNKETQYYPSWTIEVQITHDSTMHTLYKDEGVTILRLIKSLDRCRDTFKAFDESLTQGVVK